MSTSRQWMSTPSQKNRCIALVLGLSWGLTAAGPASGAASIQYEYDDANNVTSKTVDGLRTEWGPYDSKGNPSYKIEAAGTPFARRTDYTYDPRYFSKIATKTEPSVRNGSNKVTTYTYDDFANVIQQQVAGFKPDGTPVSRTWTFEYNGPLHQISKADGPRSDVSDVFTFAYYINDPSEGFNRGRLRQVMGPNGIALRDNIQYTATGKVASEQRPNGLSLSYTYYAGNDRLETLTASAAGASRTIRWTYIATGEVESVTNAYGTADAETVSFVYDDARRLVRVTDGGGNYIAYTLDTESNVTGENVYDQSGVLYQSIGRTFDAYNQLDVKTIAGESEDYDFNSSGNLVKHINAKNTTTEYGYDTLRRLTTVTEDALGADTATQDTLTAFGYDVADRVTSVQAGNGATTIYAYDDLGNLLSEQSPDRGLRLYTYDPAGNVQTTTDARGVTAAYSYDAYNRLVAIDYPGTGEDVTLAYDAGCPNGVGRLCQVADGSGITTYAYDGLGNLVEQAHTELGVEYITTYTYDLRGNISSMTTPGGRPMVYGRNARGEVASVAATVNGAFENIVSGITYRPDGQLVAMNYGNGHQDTRDYDTKGRLSALQMPAGTGSSETAPANQAPMAVSGALSLDEDTVANGTLSATDADGDPLTFSITAGPALGSVVITNATTGAYTYTPNANANGNDSFSFVAHDGALASAPATVSVTIASVNDAPTAANASFSTQENVAVGGTLSGSDIEGDALSYQLVANGSSGSVSLNASTGAFTYTPNASVSGADQFTFRVSDGSTVSNVATVDITIIPAPTNSVPALTNPGDQTSAEGQAVTLALDANDADGDTLSFSAIGLPTGLSIDENTGVISGTVASGSAGSYAASVSASDGIASTTVDFNWTVSASTGTPNLIEGTSGNDTLNGTEGDDRLEGYAKNDYLYGEGGNDILVGGTGNDWMYGGPGDDTFIIEGINGQGLDRVFGEAGNDKILGGPGDDTFVLYSFDPSSSIEIIDGAGGINIVAGSDSQSIFDFSATTFINIARIEGRGGHDKLTGTNAADLIVGGTGDDRMFGGAGDDVFLVEGAGQGLDTVNGGAGVDTLQGSDADDTFGLTIFKGADSVEVIDGGAGTNIIIGSNSQTNYDFSNTTLINIARIEGRGGHDNITGSLGDDAIWPGTGDDHLTDLGGNDTYRFELGDGTDWIDDQSGSDRIEFGPGITAAQLVVVQSGNDLIVGYASGDAITITNWFQGQRIETFAFDDGSSRTADQIEAMLGASSYAAPTSGFVHVALSAPSQSARGEYAVVVSKPAAHTQARSYWFKGASTQYQWQELQGVAPNLSQLDGLLIVTDFGVHAWKRDAISRVHQYQLYQPSTLMNATLSSVAGSSTDETWNYGYDANNNVTSIDLPTRNGGYQYDALDRLITDALGDLPTRSFSYDRNGNRLAETVDTTQVPYAYTANTNRLVAKGGEGLGHDPAGNRTSDRSGNRIFTYNGAGRLYQVFESGSLKATYTYNVLGQRTRKVTSTSTTLYHYDLAGNLIAETDEAGNVIREYVFVSRMPVAQINTVGGSDDITYLHTDHLGTPRAGTDANGVLVWRWLGEAFGATAANEDPDGDGQATVVNLRFPGQYADAETGLYYNYFRYYDPATGRYVTSDPIGLAAATNTFSYVSASPLVNKDRFGLDSDERSKNPSKVRVKNMTPNLLDLACTGVQTFCAFRDSQLRREDELSRHNLSRINAACDADIQQCLIDTPNACLQGECIKRAQDRCDLIREPEYTRHHDSVETILNYPCNESLKTLCDIIP